MEHAGNPPTLILFASILSPRDEPHNFTTAQGVLPGAAGDAAGRGAEAAGIGDGRGADLGELQLRGGRRPTGRIRPWS